MGKIKIKKEDVSTIVAVLGNISGIQSAKKCITLAADYRNLKDINQSIDDALKMAKPEGYDELQKEFQELKNKKGQDLEGANDYQLGIAVLNTWDKATKWRDINEKLEEKRKEILNAEIEFLAKTKLTDADLPKKLDSVIVANVLSYFM